MSESTMTMNRVIHAAVRRDLERLSTALAGFPDGDRSRAQDLERAFANLRRELTHHHESEDTHIWPFCAGVGFDADLLTTMESEHHRMAEALAETSTALAALARTGEAGDAAAARDSVVRTQEVVEQHLVHEETELEPLLHPLHDTPEWKAVEKKLRSAPPGVTGRFLAWVTDGMSEEHRAFFRAQVPAPVVFVFTRVFGRPYTRDIAPTWRETAPA